MFKDIKEYVKLQKKIIAAEMPSGKDLTIIQVGDIEASNRYVRNKIKDCEEVGIDVNSVRLPEDINRANFITEVLNQNLWSSAIIIQLPLPPHLKDIDFSLYIDDKKDVDGFNPRSCFDPCTPKGIMDYLRHCGWDPVGQHVVIIGRSNIVGKPMAKMMLAADATVTVCHSKTKNLMDICKSADLIICAVGKPQFLDCSELNCPVVDVGINFVDGKLVGDCYNTEGKEVTPVPGGVGLLTRLALLKNCMNTEAWKE